MLCDVLTHPAGYSDTYATCINMTLVNDYDVCIGSRSEVLEQVDLRVVIYK